MTTSTTIKVPRALRDRLADRARMTHSTMSEVIAEALDQAEERAFWASVSEHNAALDSESLAARVADPSLADDLDDDGDDHLSAEGGW